MLKNLARNLVAGTLAAIARGVLRKYRPKVVMVTGSVGKTSTKDAVAVALGAFTYVRASEKSYNSEFGVPLTILGAKNPWTSASAWISVFIRGIALVLLPSAYPKLLVLEVGADSPGDLARILRIATPDLVVVTKLPDVPVHIEAYATPDAVREEEFGPAYALSPGAPLVLPYDDAYAGELAAPLTVRTITYGSGQLADVRIGAAEVAQRNEEVVGMRTDVTFGGETYDLCVAGALGSPQLLAPAAALATAIGLGYSGKKALAALKSYVPPPGRSRLLRGREGSVLLDDSYNASPTAVEEALASLTLLAESSAGNRRIAVLGDMLELGRYSYSEHERIGRLAASQSDFLVTVGRRARTIADGARVEGMKEENVHSYDTSAEAAAALRVFVKAKDVVLIKGSQSVRTERIVEALLERPEDTKELVRQDMEWKRR